MNYTARRVEYFYANVNAKPDEAFELLDNIAALGVNFVALTSVPMGPESTQLTMFPEDASRLQAVARQTGLAVTGPQSGILVQGDDEVGAMAQIHRLLRHENIEVYASTGISDGKGHYGCVLYVRSEDVDRAVRALRTRS